MVGFAPLYRAGSSLRGSVYVEETDDAETLQRATKLIGEQFTDEAGFVAQSAVVVTYVNVTRDRDPRQQNTFQGVSRNTFIVTHHFAAVIIGGRSVVSDDLTFVEYLYSDIQWADNAEAQVMAQQYEESYMLPGSHTGSLTSSLLLTTLATLQTLCAPWRNCLILARPAAGYSASTSVRLPCARDRTNSLPIATRLISVR